MGTSEIMTWIKKFEVCGKICPIATLSITNPKNSTSEWINTWEMRNRRLAAWAWPRLLQCRYTSIMQLNVGWQAPVKYGSHSSLNKYFTVQGLQSKWHTSVVNGASGQLTWPYEICTSCRLHVHVNTSSAGQAVAVLLTFWRRNYFF